MNSQGISTAAARLRQQAREYIKAEQFEAAQTALESLVRLVPHDTVTCIELSDVMFMQGQVRGSTGPLLQALQRLPRDAPLLMELARRLLARGEVLGARACLDFLAQAPEPPPELLIAQANLRFALGEVPVAKKLVDRAMAAGVDSPGEYHLQAMLLQFSGDIEQACRVLESCLQRWPHFGDAVMTLANLRRQKPDANLLGFVQEQLRRLPEDGKDPHDQFVRAEFEYARFKVLDDLGRHEDAWPALARCNALMHQINPYDAAAETAVVDALIGASGAIGKASAGPAPVPEGPLPIFIVGMPRSGTTLLDRMLSSHSAVVSAGEIIDFWRQLHWVADVPPVRAQGLLRAIRRSPDIDFGEVGARYLRQTQWRAQGRRFYVDKLPANIQMVAFIRRALPHAPILHMVREPMDTCFSNFKAMFGNISAYSYDLQALAHYYGQYERLVRHWRASLPGAMLDVSYAALVRDPETTLREVLRHCGLQFEAGCLQPERNPAPVATPSSAQVRESIHTRGVGQWRRYAQQLEPLRLALTTSASAA
ncbi:sulfotransferase [Rhodanobacter sp. FW510-R12]|uniref:tetratricopeptide repeat-containing sulfotransferase family protein n=1 Tax=unclassified Rhodanobacter TaxID=2621553 RepID=UPI0007A9EDB3|nr:MULTISPECIES: sulfotransferase [unclassified Rhodanobacter]KZC17820.1 sulfotransferase [Rhodanobacter sp. FW104-R8]KZC27176.1 sulfotransferase [Rhodanobacter sp. FW510-T8]KZC31614.1 sulfotransferase [Rhodanobacter sp. FW510-R10]